MKTFELWQVRLERTREKAWQSWDKINDEFNLLDYDLAYSMPCKNDVDLEELFEKFNSVYPMNYKGRSMSVSDLIVFPETKEAYYVDLYGFNNISNRIFRTREFELATKLVEFAKDFDTYEFNDTVDETTPDIIAMDLSEGKITVYLDYLKDILEDMSQPFNERRTAEILISKLDEFSEMKEKENKEEDLVKTKNNNTEKELEIKATDFTVCDKDFEMEI